MIPCWTPKARVGRVGVWASPLFAAVLLLVFLFVLLLSPAAQGATQSDILKQQLSQKCAAMEQARDKWLALENELAGLEKAKDAAAEKLASLMAEVTDVGNQIQQAETDLASLGIQLEDRLVNMYKGGTSWSVQYLEAMVAEDSLTAVLERFDMLTRLADQDEQLFTEVEGYLEQSRADKVILEKKVVEQQAQSDALTESIKQLAAKQAQANAQYQSLLGQMAGLQVQIKQAEAKEAAAAAAAAARLKAVADATKNGSGSSTGTTPTTTKPTTPTTTKPGGSSGGSSGSIKYPSSAAEVAAQANFIYRTFLVPRKSVLTGELVMEVWRKYGITPAECLAVLNAESGMGSLKYGGRLVPEANNFGCMSYGANPAWAKWPPAISFGKIYVANRNWMKFYSVADGMEAWGRYIAYGRGKDCYRPLLRTANWPAFADIYYGANVAGKAKYIERVTWAYYMLKANAYAAGYYW
jgi:peptidoglycan hydrolase CwlO-like protein